MKLFTYYPQVERSRALDVFRTPKNVFLKLLVFIAVFFCMSMAESIGTVIGLMPGLIRWGTEQIGEDGTGTIDQNAMQQKLNELMEDPSNTHIMLLCTGLGTIVVLLFVRLIEGRKLWSMGFLKKNAVPHYLLGLVSGFLMFSGVVGIAYLMGGLTWNGYKGGSVGMLLLMLLGYGIQGMSEEVLCRGWFMTTVLRHQNVVWAVALNSILFGLLHAGNNGFTALAMLNLVLYAVMISIYMLRTDSLWGACAVHSIWNFVQGNFYGLPVSGIDSGDSVFSMSLTGSVLANGGDFGLEASLATTIVMLVVIAVLLLVPLPLGVNGKPAPAPAETAEKA